MAAVRRSLLVFTGLLLCKDASSIRDSAELADVLEADDAKFVEGQKLQEEEGLTEQKMDGEANPADLVRAGGIPCEHYALTDEEEAAEEDHMYQARPDAPILTQILSLANRIYNMGTSVSGWSLVKAWNFHADNCDTTDNVGIYKKGTECALAFDGTSHWDDVKADLNIMTTSWCGFSNVHAGFARKSNQFMEGTRFNEFMTVLASSECGTGGIYITGHSMGGAIAELMTACFNTHWVNEPGRRNFWPKVAGVYTIGAPGVTKGYQLQNPLTDSKCFPGLRIFNRDRGAQDPVPALTSVVNYQHPMMKPVQLTQNGEGQQVEVTLDSCDSQLASLQPRIDIMSIRQDATLHKATVYVNRLLHHFQDATADGKKPKLTNILGRALLELDAKTKKSEA